MNKELWVLIEERRVNLILYWSASGQARESGPPPKVLIKNFYFWSLLAKDFKNHFERFSVLCISFGDHTLWKRLLVGLMKILKNYEKIYLIVQDVCENG